MKQPYKRKAVDIRAISHEVLSRRLLRRLKRASTPARPGYGSVDIRHSK